MTREHEGSWLADALRGALAGGVATWLMDLTTTGLQASQSEASAQQEKAARPNDRTAIANLVARVEAAAGLTLDEGQRTAASQAVHFGLGVIPGAAYGILRNRVPWVGAARGLLFGLVLWVVNDEYLNSRLGLAGPIEAYPAETHWRGAVGHAVLGTATDTGIDLLGG